MKNILKSEGFFFWASILFLIIALILVLNIKEPLVELKPLEKAKLSENIKPIDYNKIDTKKIIREEPLPVKPETKEIKDEIWNVSVPEYEFTCEEKYSYAIRIKHWDECESEYAVFHIEWKEFGWRLPRWEAELELKAKQELIKQNIIY